MTDIAAWIAEKRRIVDAAPDTEWPQLDPIISRHVTKATVACVDAFPPAVTRRLLDAAEALDMLRRESKAYGGTSPAAEAAADAALDALRGGDHG